MKYLIGLDPSSKTGFCRLNPNGTVDLCREMSGIGDKDPKRLATLVDSIMAHIPKESFVAIEGFAFNATGQGVGFQYGIGYMIRDRLYRKGIPFIDVEPSKLKSFAGAKTHYGEKGSKKRFKGKEVKQEMARAVREMWGFQHTSDNVTDAYALAQYALDHKKTMMRRS